MYERHSIEFWRDVCRSRLDEHTEFRDLVGKEWLEAQLSTLRCSTAQVDCHPLLRIVCATDGTPLEEAENALKLLSRADGFPPRLDALKRTKNVAQAWSRWNELRSASLVARAGFAVQFSLEGSLVSVKSADYYVRSGPDLIAFEVATVGDTPERIGKRRKFQQELDRIVHRAAKRGERGTWGGVVNQLDRFSGCWEAVKYLMSIKKGSTQSTKTECRLLHIISSDENLHHYDFLPDCYFNSHGLRYRYSGRIYAAFYGIKGQLIYWRHPIDRPATSPTAVIQKAPGRFVDHTSLSAAILTLHSNAQDGSAAIGKPVHVLYVPLQGAGTPIPSDVLTKLDSAFDFNPDFSMALEFPGPHPMLSSVRD